MFRGNYNVFVDVGEKEKRQNHPNKAKKKYHTPHVNVPRCVSMSDSVRGSIYTDIDIEEHNIQELPQANDNTTSGHRTHQTLSTLLGEFFESTTTGVPQSQEEQLQRALQTLGDLPLADSLLEQLHTEKDISGVPQEFIDALDRVAKKALKPDQACPICTSDFLDDPHPLVVRLPCEGRHTFDLECIAPWLKVHSTCPMCRKNMLDKKFDNLPEDDEEEEDGWEMYG